MFLVGGHRLNDAARVDDTPPPEAPITTRFVANRKGNALADAGWSLLRITGKELTERPDRVVARVRSALLRTA